MTLTVWGRATSSNVQKVMWAVGELGLAFERIDKGGVHGGLDEPDFVAMTPHRLIPVVRLSDGIVMWESNAIVRRLAARDPERRLWPADGQASADADMWAEWAHNGFARASISLFWALVRTRPADRDAALIERLGADCTKALATAEAVLGERDYLASDRLSIADIVLGGMLYRYFEMELERPDMPALARYYDRLTARPAYAEHVMVDFSSLRPAA